MYLIIAFSIFNLSLICCCNLDAGAVIHAHSTAAVKVTLITPGVEFKISHIEMIKGIKKCSTGELL